MGRLLGGVAGLALGYVFGVAAGALLVALFSTNTHDKSVEMAMTSLLIAGPAGAVAGLIVGLIKGGARQRAVG